MRREFSKRVKRDAFVRAAGKCEVPWCQARLSVGKFHYDHVIPDALGGDPTLENCAVICVACHKNKTGKLDARDIAKTKRIQDKYRGIKASKPKLRSQGFRKSSPQNTATRPVNKWSAWGHSR